MHNLESPTEIMQPALVPRFTVSGHSRFLLTPKDLRIGKRGFLFGMQGRSLIYPSDHLAMECGLCNSWKRVRECDRLDQESYQALTKSCRLVLVVK